MKDRKKGMIMIKKKNGEKYELYSDEENYLGFVDELDKYKVKKSF
jgi:hypothetical protein